MDVSVLSHIIYSWCYSYDCTIHACMVLSLLYKLNGAGALVLISLTEYFSYLCCIIIFCVGIDSCNYNKSLPVDLFESVKNLYIS